MQDVKCCKICKIVERIEKSTRTLVLFVVLVLLVQVYFRLVQQSCVNFLLQNAEIWTYWYSTYYSCTPVLLVQQSCVYNACVLNVRDHYLRLVRKVNVTTVHKYKRQNQQTWGCKKKKTPEPINSVYIRIRINRFRRFRPSSKFLELGCLQNVSKRFAAQIFHLQKWFSAECQSITKLQKN